MENENLTGHEAIEYAERTDAPLNKYADPTEDARDNISIEEAREIASEDPSLILIKAQYTIVTMDAGRKPRSEQAENFHEAKSRAHELASDLSFNEDPVWCDADGWHQHENKNGLGGYDITEREGAAVVIY